MTKQEKQNKNIHYSYRTDIDITPLTDRPVQFAYFDCVGVGVVGSSDDVWFTVTPALNSSQSMPANVMIMTSHKRRNQSIWSVVNCTSVSRI